MARNYTQIGSGIWGSQSFRSLTPQAQWLYFRLITSPELSYVGVSDWRPKRTATLAEGLTPAQVTKAGQALVDAGLAVIDDETEEILVVTFLRHDTVLRSSKMAKPITADISRIYSLNIKRALLIELQDLHQAHPHLALWSELATYLEDDQDLKRGDNTPPDRGGHTLSHTLYAQDLIGYPESSDRGAPIRDRDIDKRVETRDQRQGTKYPEEFLDFYNVYPRKEDKAKALKAWKKVISQGTPNEILIQAAQEYAQDPNRHPAYTKLPATWLNAGSWDNEALPAREQATPDKSLQAIMRDQARTHLSAVDRPQLSWSETA